MAYTVYTAITINNAFVSADHVSFPIWVAGTFDGTAGEADLRSAANGGKVENVDSTATITGIHDAPADFVFSPNSDGSSPYDFEIELYDPATGELAAHVRIPTMDASDDLVIYMCYGDVAVTTSQENINAVWVGYRFVYHFSQASGGLLDSSGTIGVTEYNTAAGTARAAGAYGGYGYEKSSGYWRKNIAYYSWPASFGWMVLANNDTTARRYLYATYKAAEAGWWIGNFETASTDMHCYTTSGGYCSANVTMPVDAVSRMYSYRRISSAQTIYRNGVLQSDTATGTGTLYNTHYSYVGADGNGASPWDGLMSELRASRVNRAASWLIDTSTTRRNIGDFLSFGAEVSDEVGVGVESMFMGMNF